MQKSPKEMLEKRINDHVRTISIFLAGSNYQKDDETEREYRERLITLGAKHAYSEVNLPLMRCIVDEFKLRVEE